MLILNIACSDSGSRLFDWPRRWTGFAASAFAGAVQMGDKQATLGRAKSLLRHQRGSQRRSYRFTLSNNPAPAMSRGASS
jgi:hypothetical protein